MRTNITYFLPIAIVLFFAGSCHRTPALAETVAEIPDLVWRPAPFLPAYGSAIRYIDFEHGDDRNPGTKPLPWKHHPWDSQARSRAKSAQGADTYIFKKGVIYRGALVARESGSPRKPIRLTVDPDWGSGDAVLAGSTLIEGKWRPCNAKESTVLPTASRSRTWCTEWTGRDKPRLLWEVRDGTVQRIPIARTPNWNISNVSDPRSEWLEITGTRKELQFNVDDTAGFFTGNRVWLSNRNTKNAGRGKSPGVSGTISDVGPNHLVANLDRWDLNTLKVGGILTNGSATTRITALPNAKNRSPVRFIVPDTFQHSPGKLRGATLWLESGAQVKPRAGEIIGSDPEEKSITVDIHTGPRNFGPYNRYYLEGLPQFLDTPGEYFYQETAAHTGILYLRLPGDRNPNESRIEGADLRNILTLNDSHHIDISGLSFMFSNQVPVRSNEARHAPMHAAAVQIRGSSSDISVHHCHLQYLATGIVAYPARSESKNILDSIKVSDNEFSDIDSSAVVLGNGRGRQIYGAPGARLIHTQVQRNRLEQIGQRPLALWGAGAHGHGIDINGAELVEVSGNHINRVWGAGIALILGSDYDRSPVNRPLLRGLIHHNKITNSILGIQDIGGIGTWMGGPTYIYNNISGNPVGYKHAEYRAGKRRDWYRSSSYGIGIYLDGQYKGYVFNNIIWGLNNNVNDPIYNSVAVNEAMGFMNTVFQNTFYRFGVGLHKGMFQHNRSYYIGNLMLDIGSRFIRHEARDDSIDYQTLAYGHNVFSGTPPEFGQIGRRRSPTYRTINDWRNNLERHGLMATETGTYTTNPVVENANALDFRPRPGSAAIDAGARVFVPWGLYRVVGEWHFLQSRQHPDIVSGENLNMNQEWVHRAMFQDIPRNNLSCKNIKAANYTTGILEDWTRGALRLNGSSEYCQIDDMELKAGYTWENDQTGKSGTVLPEMRDTVDIATDNFLIESVVAADSGHTKGGISGKLKGRGYALTIDGQGALKLTLEFGGKTCSRVSSIPVNDGQWHHVIAEVNRGSPRGINLYIDGKLANGQWNGEMDPSTSLSNTANFSVGKVTDDYFSGRIDFLRIAKGTLSQAETSIGELYNWEFNGPFLRDFSGNPPSGAGRDAGAIEYRPD
ncbi:MAG: LamG-like jellyroll fold domain-containing protein [Thiogranum sp.]